MQTALTIAGSDPTGGAGLQADLQVFRRFKIHGCGVVTALTVQDTSGVRQVLPVFPSVVLDQLRVLLADLPPSAVKIGMLASDDVLRNVVLGLATLPETTPLVIDPVLRASDGSFLLEKRAWSGLCEFLSRASLVTPNLEEAAELTGTDVSSEAGCEAAARVFITEMGAGAALLTGGHRDGAPDDLLAIRGDNGPLFRWLRADRIESAPTHGTGCALSAAITAALAAGRSLEEATLEAQAFVQSALRRAQPLGGGARLLDFS